LAQALSWLGDEHLVSTVIVAGWLASRLMGPAVQRRTTHVASTVLAAIALSHATKNAFSQRRPDRTIDRVRGRGIPKSGSSRDAFPSGHALITGALASALSRVLPGCGSVVWWMCGIVSAARVVLLAHWLSDVLVGLAGGITIERLVRTMAAGADRSADGTD
jgi:undecaprenyl-diphosphatase